MKNKGFTLVEILVVLAIITILSGIILYSLESWRELSERDAILAFEQQLKSGLCLGLVSGWGLDEGSDIAVYDSGRFSNTGVIQGATWSVDCISGFCLLFDGADDYVDFGAGSSFDITDVITVSAWIYPQEKSTTFRTILSKGYNTTEAFQLRMDRTSSGNHIFFEISDGSALHSSPHIAITNDKWHHVVGYYNGSGVGIFVDGEDYGLTGATVSINTNANNLLVGKNTNGEFWYGYIDDVFIFNKVMTSAEMQDIYYSGR